MEYRSDSAPIKGIRKTPQGGVILSANLTRTGVFTYDYGNGVRVRELRHPDEVFKADSLATLAAAPLVIGHPAEVNPSNYTALMKGHVDGTPNRDGIFVAADVRVQDGETIRRVVDAKETDPDKLTEISCGYRCRVVKDSGVYNGEPYDARQEGIVYNHVGIGPKDWGRAGNEVKIRLDAADGPAWLSGEQITPVVSGLLLDVTTATDKKTDSAVTDVAALLARIDALQAQVDALTADKTKLTADLATANDPKRLDGLVTAEVDKRAARAALVALVAPVLGADFKADGKSDHELRIAALARLQPETKLDGKSEIYVQVRFDMAQESAREATAALGAVNGASPTVGNVAGTAHTDGKDPVIEAREDSRYASANAWKGEAWLKANPRKK